MNWETTLDNAIEQFGSTPRPELAETLAQHHQAHPATVQRLINEIAAKHQQGEIRSPWGVLKTRLEQLATTQPKAKAGTDRERAKTRAEQWMRAAGLHYPTWTETHDELFGERGQLAEWPDLADHFEHLYAELRPSGERVDAEAIERAETWKQQRAAAKTPQPAKEAA